MCHYIKLDKFQAKKTKLTMTIIERLFAVTSQDLRLEAGGSCKPGDLDLKGMSDCCTWRQESQLSSDI